MKTTIAVITLNPDSEKVQELLSHLAKQNLSAQVIAGVDGRAGFPKLAEEESIDQARSLKMRLIELSKSEVGCYLSHFRIIKNAYNEGLDRICILEDDVLIESDFGRVLSSLETLPDTIEHIRLMGLKMHKRKEVFSLSDSHTLTRPVKGLCGTQGYVISRSGMKKVLKHGSSISEPIDKFYDHFWDINLKSYCIEPHVIWERPIIESSIVKASRSEASRVGWKKVKRHLIKMQRGFKRRVYLLKNWNQFFPAKKTEMPMGKTARIH